MFLLILPAFTALVAASIEHFQRGELEDRGGVLLGLVVGLGLSYGHRFLRPISIDFAAVSKYVGWLAVLLFSAVLAFPEIADF